MPEDIEKLNFKEGWHEYGKRLRFCNEKKKKRRILKERSVNKERISMETNGKENKCVNIHNKIV